MYKIVQKKNEIYNLYIMMWNKFQVVPLTIHVPSFKADMNVKDKF